MDIASLESSTTKLLEELLTFVESQREQWQKIPWLTIEAAGKVKESMLHPSTYQSGLWPIFTTVVSGGRSTAFVDLATGKLVNTGNRTQPPSRRELLDILSNPQVVDAGNVISGLESYIEQPHLQGADPVAMEKWREKMRWIYKVQNPYTR